MKIGIIDAEIINKKRHRFPNLASMKLSAYHKSIGDNVALLTSYNNVDEYDKCYISKVFTDTDVPNNILNKSNVEYGGTGFFYDKAKPLPYEIEHIMPDYHLYDNWISDMVRGGVNESTFKYYTDYSIGFLTRGCFRQCPFCVNQNYKNCIQHSNVNEFLAPDRDKICFLDDNFFACKDWKSIISDVKDTGCKFQFKQGLDERLLTDEKVEEMLSWRYIDRFIFAFDNIEDYDLIKNKLDIIRKHTTKEAMFYVLCGYDYNNKYDMKFWQNDIINLFKRIELLGKYGHRPYVMRHKNYNNSPYRGTYINIAKWCNMPRFYTKVSYSRMCLDPYNKGKTKMSATQRYYYEALEIPEIENYIHRVLYHKQKI